MVFKCEYNDQHIRGLLKLWLVLHTCVLYITIHNDV